jgi:LysM repeat protein
MHAPPPLLAEVAKHAPAEASFAVTRAMAKTPADRFPTAGDFSRALSAAGSTPSDTYVLPTGASTAERAGVRAQPGSTVHIPRRPRWLGIAAVVGVLAIGGTLAALALVPDGGGTAASRNVTTSTPRAGGNDTNKSRDVGTNAHGNGTTGQQAPAHDSNDVYIVKEGDTLGGIADKTGVPVEKLQELNPGLDQFSLETGQKVRLR